MAIFGPDDYSFGFFVFAAYTAFQGHFEVCGDGESQGVGVRGLAAGKHFLSCLDKSQGQKSMAKMITKNQVFGFLESIKKEFWSKNIQF